jgi:hypothetical protein
MGCGGPAPKLALIGAPPHSHDIAPLSSQTMTEHWDSQFARSIAG